VTLAYHHVMVQEHPLLMANQIDRQNQENVKYTQAVAQTEIPLSGH